MIGLPGQTEEDLVNDILFYRDMDIDMIGIKMFAQRLNLFHGPVYPVLAMLW